ncbi:hypothetical protein MVEG_07417 [Podila verticillata NRRL 6337]|nr:hypothetical protein MVEG_07417 [Podila verticillata NRRL 6337]
MGKLVPRCFAANSDTLYFLARAVRTDDKTQQELVALVKSDPYPASIQAARWTVVSTSSSKHFSRWYYRYTTSSDLSCTVDDNGIFMFTGPFVSDARVSFRYDPLAPKNTYHDTSPKNATGEWITLYSTVNITTFYPWGTSSMHEPFILFNVNGRNHTNNTTPGLSQGSDSTQFVAQFFFDDSNTPKSIPRIQYSAFNSSGVSNGFATSNLTTTNGTVQSLRYGNEKLWAVMETGNPYDILINNKPYPRWHRTLTVFPLTAPYNFTSPPAAIVTVPWDLTCESSRVRTQAVFGDKLYYACSIGHMSAHLYTYDSATNQTQSPVETSTACTYQKMTLVSGKPGSPSPAYGLMITDYRLAVLDLSPENYGRCREYDSDGSRFLQVNAMIEAPTEPEECLETCTEMKAMAAFFGGIFGGIAVLLICICLTVRHCLRKRRRKRELAAVAVATSASEEVALDTIEEHSPPPYKQDPTMK